jgi:hypothetical protein
MQMRAKNITAALLVALGTSAALTVAAPAQADPTDDQSAQQAEQLDQQFIKLLSDHGIRMQKNSDAIDLAHSTCGVLARTSSVESAMRHVQNSTEWTDAKKVGAFASLSVQAYCPASMPKT